MESRNLEVNGFGMPSQAYGTEDERLEVFRRVRDEIRQHVEQELVNEK